MKMMTITWLRLLAVTGLFAGNVLRADDWPQFRGPGGDGVSTAKNLPLHWAPTTNVLWKTTIPGRGRSSPVVMADRVWVTTAVETNPRQTKAENDPVIMADRLDLGLVCLERATGKILYHASLFCADNPPPVHQFNSFATPTPVVEPGRVYCDFGAFGTASVESYTGKVLWKNQVVIDHQLGPGSSPVVWKDRLILVRDGRDQQFVAALDKHTGKLVWKTPRPPIITKSPNTRKSFSTPAIVESGGRAQIVAPTAHWFVGYDAATGRELWRVKHGTSFSIGPRPVSGNGLVYAMTGMSRQLWAIRPDGTGDVTETHVAWKVDSLMPALSSPLPMGRELYTVSDVGAVSCLNAMTGEKLGGRNIGGKVAASPLLADGRIYIFDQEGKATVLKADKELDVLAENQLDGPLFASPAVVDDALYVRTDSSLYCLRQK